MSSMACEVQNKVTELWILLLIVCMTDEMD